jgi:hypothetical protein
VDLLFDGADASIDYADWSLLIKQIKTRSLAKWKFSRMDPPMGEPDMQRLLSQVSNTPAYQLLLAGFDVSERVGLASDLQDAVIQSRCISLSGWTPSMIGSGGLFFVPDSMVADAAEPRKELVSNNKLCQLVATVGAVPLITKYYIPYATPIDFTTKPTEEAKKLWERIRAYYYAFR